MSALVSVVALIVGAATDAAVEGAINAGCRNADKLPALGEGLARGWVRALQALNTKTVEDAKPDPALQQTLDESLAEAIKEGKVPG